MAMGIFLNVTSRGVLLVSGGYRPGMLLKILLCTTPTTKNSPAQNVSGGKEDPCKQHNAGDWQSHALTDHNRISQVTGRSDRMLVDLVLGPTTCFGEVI